MSNVINFPSTNDRNETDIEKGLREGLSGHGFSTEGIEAAIALAMHLFRESKSIVAQNLTVKLSSSLSEEQTEELQSELSNTFQLYQRDIGDFIGKLILKLALMEIKARDNSPTR